MCVVAVVVAVSKAFCFSLPIASIVRFTFYTIYYVAAAAVKCDLSAMNFEKKNTLIIIEISYAKRCTNKNASKSTSRANVFA
jgi:hypothetical protein